MEKAVHLLPNHFISEKAHTTLTYSLPGQEPVTTSLQGILGNVVHLGRLVPATRLCHERRRAREVSPTPRKGWRCCSLFLLLLLEYPAST